MDFSETIAASDLKVIWSRHLIEYMKIYDHMTKMAAKPIYGKNLLNFSRAICKWLFKKTFCAFPITCLASFLRATNDCSVYLGFRAHFVQKMPFGCPWPIGLIPESDVR